MQIIPTTEPQKDFTQVEKRITEIKDFSRWIQVDVIDNVFTEGRTFDLELLSRLDFNTDNILWEIHLMVNEPMNWIEKCSFVGANRVTGQVEMMSDRDEFVNSLKLEGLEAGLAFDIETEMTEVPEETDLVLLMGRKAGFGFIPMDERVFEKIKIADEMRAKREKKFLIGIDGGANGENYLRLAKAGVDIIYSGSDFFELKDMASK